MQIQDKLWNSEWRHLETRTLHSHSKLDLKNHLCSRTTEHFHHYSWPITWEKPQIVQWRALRSRPLRRTSFYRWTLTAWMPCRSSSKQTHGLVSASRVLIKAPCSPNRTSVAQLYNLRAKEVQISTSLQTRRCNSRQQGPSLKKRRVF